MKRLIFAALAAAVFTGNQANAQDFSASAYSYPRSLYISGRLGAGWGNGDMAVTAARGFQGSIGGALGTVLNEGPYGELRAEIEFMKNQNLSDKGYTLKSSSMLFNMYANFNIDSVYSPYIGAGFGGGFIGMNGPGGKDSANAFAYSFMAGLSRRFPDIPSMSWDMGYRYFHTSGVSMPLAGNRNVSLSTHQLMLGIRYRF
ncbi:MAG: outer membrane beta-barrel protein [Alphaproteobacteria bacterium]|nr:outer membrane beta-barrel protein [Alphaproteobacteria bacterium]